MLCMTNFARASAGLRRAGRGPSSSDSSAQRQGRRRPRCDSFSHFACGREFTYWIRAGRLHRPKAAGTPARTSPGEPASYGSVRAIFRAWMSSPTHRRNILGDYREVGIGLERGDLKGNLNARVWTSHFGSRCEVPAV